MGRWADRNILAKVYKHKSYTELKMYRNLNHDGVISNSVFLLEFANRMDFSGLTTNINNKIAMRISICYLLDFYNHFTVDMYI
jgi:hypothetical protein